MNWIFGALFLVVGIVLLMLVYMCEIIQSALRAMVKELDRLDANQRILNQRTCTMVTFNEVPLRPRPLVDDGPLDSYRRYR